jgi:hypothetical protein
LDRRTNRSESSGGASPTIVTSRAADDDLIADDQDTGPSGIMAPPRRVPSKPAAPARDETKEATANGGSVSQDVPLAAEADVTVADVVPALPADTIGSARTGRAHEPGEGQKQEAPDAGADDDPPGFSFTRPDLTLTSSSADDLWPGDAAGSSAKSSADDPSPTVSSPVVSSSPAPSGSSGSGSPAPESPSVSPAAFAWEMPDPPPESPASPARTFLRAGTTAKAKPGPVASSGGQGKAAAGSGAATARNTSPKAQARRSARQAHLTVARVEPWSVMKFSFVVSLVAFVILFVAVSVLYGVLSGIGVFDSLQRVVASVTSSQTSTGVNAKAWFSASRVLGYTALLGSLNIVLITAMSTIGAVVYNLTSRLVGGVEVTLRETELPAGGKTM